MVARLDFLDLRDLAAFADLMTTFAAGFLAASARGLVFCFVETVLVALRAGALPAAERFVAGLSPMDFPAKVRFRDAVDELRAFGRDEPLLTLLTIGLLMGNTPDFNGRAPLRANSPSTNSRHLNTVALVNQRRKRVCGHNGCFVER